MKTSVLFAAIVGIFCPLLLNAQTVQHPLDPLSWQEYWALLETLQEAERLNGETQFAYVNLREPAKDVVLAWEEGQPIPRSAFGVVVQGEETYEVVVDLNARTISSWEELEGMHHNWLGSEFGGVNPIVKSDERFIEAMRLRGIDDLTFVDCVGLPPGYYDTDYINRGRVAFVTCDDARTVRNTWTRKIEGVTVIVDMDKREVVHLEDEGVVPMPSVSADYDQGSLGEPRDVPGPLNISQPLGPGFEIEGHTVSWQKWQFHVKPDMRVGMVVSQVSYDDDGDSRPVLYQGHLSEIFVPYMDPAFGWFLRNFLDAGEVFGGGLTAPLMKGLDCPDNAVYMDALFPNGAGRPRTAHNTICLFERKTGDMSWRHWSGSEGASESRVKRDLVVRTAAVLGNYDYVFDWIFQQNGSIQVAVGATGIAETKMVAEENALAETFDGSGGTRSTVNGRPDAYGRFVDPQIVAVNHDHYFNFRLDLDVDGQANALQIDRLKTQTLHPDHPRRSVWVSEPERVRQESDAKLNINLETPALWRVVSTSKTNHVGYPTSYQLMPGKNANTLLSEDDYPRRRAGFINHHLWATPYRVDERFAAGDYPVLSRQGYGLPVWTSENRSIADTDIVLWYTVGMHHMVRAEDWPLMPVLWHTFELRPFDFFNRNPAMDLPK